MNHDIHSSNPSSSSAMKHKNNTGGIRLAVWTLALGLAFGSVGCFDQLDRVNRVQTNLIDKSIFEGEWWFVRTVIEMDDDAAYAAQATGAFAPWVGAMSEYDLLADSGAVGRIRWVIDENFLYAYRSTEVIVGSNVDADSEDFRGSPLAAYRIVNHVDVRQEYNPGTGEPTNVVSESMDRRWYDRQFVRVDWSRNFVTFGLFAGHVDFEEIFGSWRREPVPLGITDEGNTDFPAAWRPQFVRAGEDDTYRFAAEWPAEEADTIHYMSFVTRDIWTPLNCFGSTCGTSIVLTMRDAFLRVPPEHEYAAEVLANSEYDRFGIIRTESRTYVRGGLERDELGQFCDAAEDCLTGACNMATHRCTGGLTDELGETDLLTYYRLRHNFYSDSFTDRECTTDWECSERALLDTDSDGIGDTSFDADGDGMRDGGSVCDPAAGRCTIPVRDRPVREVAYYTSPGHPVYLLRPSFQLFSQWNEAFMTGHRALTGRGPATGARVACQSTNPTDYCYCGETISAAEVGGDDTCAWRQDFFRTPAENTAAGGVDVFDCYVAGAGDAAVSTFDVEHPERFADYDPTVWTQLHFVGEECMLVLRVNSCDADPTAECEQLGDIRYNMFNYIDAPTDFCGVMQPVQDPTNGEAIVSPVNMAGRCIDSNFTGPLFTWPILRGEDPEGLEAYITGDELRTYMEARGRVHRPEGIAPGHDPGRVTPGGTRPTLPADLHGVFTEGLEAALARGLGDLHGDEGRRLLMSGRMHNLMGSDLEERLAGGMAGEGFVSTHPEEATAAAFMDAGAVRPNIDVDDPASLERLTPIRDDFDREMAMEMRRDQALMERGVCVIRERAALSFSSQFGRYWAEAFRNYPVEEAHVRWNQAWLRAVMQHELGHGLGLEHNFGATLDRDNYQAQWFNIEFGETEDGRDDLPLPRPIEFDTEAPLDGVLTTTEWEAYRLELERVRAARNLAGAGNYMTASTMDYPGDLSDQMGIAPYDHAAIYYNYFGEVEALANTAAEPALHTEPGSSRDRILRTDNHEHHLMTFYRGGEACQVDSECPYSAASGALNDGQPIFQRCVTNPRFSSIPESCSDPLTGRPREHCICSAFDSDFDDYVANAPGTGYDSDIDSDGAADHLPIRYLFGSNPRVNDISWCTWFDAGESFVETINVYRETFLDGYLLNYFRRFRRPFYAGAWSYRYVVNAAKVYQHLLFRAIYEPGFQSDTGPIGFDDQYQASIAVMNWLAELASMPDVGSYELNPLTNTYDYVGEDLGTPGADAILDPGVGFHHWSRYQAGEVGFFRLERSGVMWDKLRALRALTTRDWGLSFTIDERYYINFYDFFPNEMTELFGGFILDDAEWYAPRVTGGTAAAPEIEYPNWFGGITLFGPQCTDPGTGGDALCRGSIRDEYPSPPIGHTSNDVLRTYAAIFALSEFPVFYDTSWERRLAIFSLENGDGFTIPNRQPDGSTTCYIGPVATSPAHVPCGTPDDADYITYTSDRVHTTYVAVRVRTNINAPALEEEQLGFEFLSALSAVNDRIAVLEASGTGAEELRQLRERRVHDESFLVTLIELQRAFGITSWL